MTSERKQLLTSLGCFLLVVGIGGALLIWPVRKQAHAVRAETIDLHAQIANLAGTAERVEQLQRDLAQARARMASDFKIIPSTPSDINSRLSLHVDGQIVQDWSLTQGMPQSARSDDAVKAMVVPWTAEIKSRFEAVYDVLRTAEMMDELVRVSSVRLSSTGGSRQSGPGGRPRVEPQDTPIVTAAIVFEAVYEPDKEQP
jgi:hypothetical protein